MKARTIAVRYALFAAAATGVNLATQAVSLALYDGRYGLYLAMALGTGTGLLLKYALDKRFIFSFKPTNLREDFGTFVLYTAMSVVTTIIFWGTELLFDYLFEAQIALFIGAAIGLAIGYTTKYFLSKHFVFNRRPRRPRGGRGRPTGAHDPGHPERSPRPSA